MNKRTTFPNVALAAAVAALGFSAATIAQTAATATKSEGKASAAKAGDKSSDAKSGGSLAGADRTFVMKAAQGGMAEVEAGKAAQSKAQSDSVKKFAEHMVTDHSKANDELMSLAKSKNVDVPSALDKDHKAKMDKMAKLSGPEFDRAYMKDMVDDHKKTVADFEKQAKGGKDAELKQWAESKLPTLREHLKMAQSTHDEVAKGGGKSSSSGASGSTASKTGGSADPAKPVETANSKGNTTGTNTQNTAGAAPKPQTTK